MYQSTKIIELGSCAFRQPKAKSHCRHIHGYRLISKIWFNCKELDENNWVMDFGGLKELKDVLERNFDHTLAVDGKDPLLSLFRQVAAADGAQLVIFEDGVGIEKFAAKVFEIAQSFVAQKTNNRVWVSKVEVWEHEKNSAIFTKEEKCGRVLEPVQSQTKDKFADLKAEEIKLEVPPPGPAPVESGARVGPGPVTKGWSNPFAGTSWGT